MTATKICALDELEVNQAVKVEIDGIAIALVRDAAGDVFAIGDTCTHGDISLSEGFVEGQTLECWAHGSMFSLTTGKPLSLPAYDPVPVYNVELIDGFVFVDPSVTVAV
ncbi:non-heme iron oxygenase ferredoxin subunit [Cryobacterium suzukii]|uniref:Non-heme iron oxygenase ferredoxin subunit n=1 Tax=Cryobacterium suzukii TaxID=1259198 RepID=A0A4R9ADQ1_9MICO|nr:non-heme iron oxygenase ferredoxin subunit [Cryobacterium suzukii]TFD57829.1 non-heme iron oxygenase ferredoxin subunit [Cryobacterium suzukii]